FIVMLLIPHRLTSPTKVHPLSLHDALPISRDSTSQERAATTLSGLTVTAQKREEALQDVPIVINVLPEQLLQDAGVHDIKELQVDRKSTRLNSSHVKISYAVFCLKKKKIKA